MPMRVLVIGGSGEFGLPACKALTRLDEVDHVAIGSRDVGRAESAADQCGPKVSAMQLDAADEAALATAMGSFDFANLSVVSTPAIEVADFSVAVWTHAVDMLSPRALGGAAAFDGGQRVLIMTPSARRRASPSMRPAGAGGART